MSEPYESEDLSPFEARLAELMPRPAQIGRDEILFEAGREDAYRQQRRVLRRWYAVSAVLLMVICGQWIVMKRESTPGGTPSIADAPSSTEEVVVPSNLQLVEGSHDPATSSNPPEVSSESVAQVDRSSRVPSIWEKLIPLPSSADATIALGRDLTVGSVVRGMPYDSLPIPKAGRMPAEDEPILSPMYRTRLSE